MSAAIRDAIILTAPNDAVRRVAGMPLVLRTALVLQRSGIERVTVVGPVPPPVDPRIRCVVRPAVTLAPAASDALYLVVGPGTVIDEALVRDVERRAEPGRAVAVEREGAWVRAVPGTRLLEPGAQPGAPAIGTLASADGPPGAIERSLLRGLENPRDGYLDRLIHRRLSRAVTWVLLRTPLTPNAVTLVGIAIGVVGGLAIGSSHVGGVLAGLAALLLSGILDCSDGEIARVTFSESRLGHVLDITGDTLVHAALLAGIAMRVADGPAVPSTAVLVVLGVGVVGAFVAITWSERTEARRHTVAGWENRILDGVLSPLTTRDWYVFPIAFALAGRLDLLVPAAAVGAHLFWITVAGLVARVLRRT